MVIQGIQQNIVILLMLCNIYMVTCFRLPVSHSTVASTYSCKNKCKSFYQSTCQAMSLQEPSAITMEDLANFNSEDAPLLIIPRTIDNLNGREHLRWQKALKFIGILQQSFLQQDAQLLLSSLDPQCKWKSPQVSDLQELKEELPKFFAFYDDPRLQIFNITMINDNNQQFGIQISYQLSAWWPLPWRPRIIVPGTAKIIFSGASSSVMEVSSTWDVNPVQIITKQLPPRIWDIYSVFSSPTPEYPPLQKLDFAFKNVKLHRIPPTITHRVSWTAPAKYRGPPISVVPDFVLTGFVPNTPSEKSAPLQATLPVDVQSSRFSYDNRDYKMTTWQFHVPTALQSKVVEKILSGWSEEVEGDTLLTENEENEFNSADNGGESAETDSGEEDDDDVLKGGAISNELVSVSGNDNLSVLRTLKNGAERGVLTPELMKMKDSLNFMTEDEMLDFERNQRIRRSIRVEPERIIAAVDIRGEIDAKKINNALKIITEAISSAPCNKKYRIKSANVLQDEIQSVLKLTDNDVDKISKVQSLFGLRLGATKMCFDENAEPAMAVYELQYDFRLFTVTVDLEEI